VPVGRSARETSRPFPTSHAWGIYRPAPLTTKSASRAPHSVHRNRLAHVRTVVAAPCCSASAAVSGSKRCRHALHQTIRRALAATAWPRVRGGIGRRRGRDRRNFGPVERTLAVVIEPRLPMQSALPMPIEDCRASAALRNGLRAARRVFECLHTRLTPSATALRQDRARRTGWLGRRMGLLWW